MHLLTYTNVFFTKIGSDYINRSFFFSFSDQSWTSFPINKYTLYHYLILRIPNISAPSSLLNWEISEATRREQKKKKLPKNNRLLTLCNSVVAFPLTNLTAFSFRAIITCFDLTNVVSPNNFWKRTKDSLGQLLRIILKTFLKY